MSKETKYIMNLTWDLQAPDGLHLLYSILLLFFYCDFKTCNPCNLGDNVFMIGPYVVAQVREALVLYLGNLAVLPKRNLLLAIWLALSVC